jgi:ribosomal protein L11 methyltransferase
MIQPKQFIGFTYTLEEERFEDAAAAVSLLVDTSTIGITEGIDELTIWFVAHPKQDTSISIRHLQTQLESAFAQFNIHAKCRYTQVTQEENWNAAWEASIEPVRVSERITITPSWKAETVESPIKVVINPQMSFGTGHHETTRLMGALLEETVKPNDVWVDAGTGTGVLAIIALRCGAGRVIAFDHDEWAVQNSLENLQLNKILTDNFAIFHSNIYTYTFPQCHGITANIHKNLVCDNLLVFHRALHQHSGTLLVSGLLRYDEAEVRQYAAQAGFRYHQTRQEGEWIALHFQA